jgi:hypothetical protein
MPALWPPLVKTKVMSASVDAHDGGDSGAAAFHHHPDRAHGFVTDRNRIAMRPARQGQSDGDVDDRPDRPLRRNVDQDVSEHCRSPRS